MEYTRTCLYVPESRTAVLIGAVKSSLRHICNVVPILGPLTNEKNHEILMKPLASNANLRMAKVIIRRHLDFVEKDISSNNKATASKGTSCDSDHNESTNVAKRAKLLCESSVSAQANTHDDDDDIEIIDLENDDNVTNNKSTATRKKNTNRRRKFKKRSKKNKKDKNNVSQSNTEVIDLDSEQEIATEEDDIISISSVDTSSRCLEIGKKEEVNEESDLIVEVRVVNESDVISPETASSSSSSCAPAPTVEFVDLSNSDTPKNCKAKKRKKIAKHFEKMRKGYVETIKNLKKDELRQIGFKIHDGFSAKEASTKQAVDKATEPNNENATQACDPIRKRVLQETEINTPAATTNNAHLDMRKAEILDTGINVPFVDPSLNGYPPVFHSSFAHTVAHNFYAPTMDFPFAPQQHMFPGMLMPQPVVSGNFSPMANRDALCSTIDTVIDLDADRVGTNVCIPNDDSTAQPKGPRPIIIDGSNVAFSHGRNTDFSFKGLQICINYFKTRGHKTIAIMPNFRKALVSDDILNKWEKDGTLVFTPSRKVNGKLIVSHDDRYVIQCAAAMGGIIVSKDNFREFLGQNDLWDETIQNRLLMYTWIEDLLMFPEDPLGRNGPTLDAFLKFPSPNNRSSLRCKRGKRK